MSQDNGYNICHAKFKLTIKLCYLVVEITWLGFISFHVFLLLCLITLIIVMVLNLSKLLFYFVENQQGNNNNSPEVSLY